MHAEDRLIWEAYATDYDADERAVEAALNDPSQWTLRIFIDVDEDFKGNWITFRRGDLTGPNGEYVRNLDPDELSDLEDAFDEQAPDNVQYFD